jgi:hypothetical protein
MYESAEKNLAELLSRQVYPQLMDTKFTWNRGAQSIPYRSLLVGNKPDPVRCRQAATEVVKELAKSGGVKEFGSRQPVRAELWGKQLFRGLGAVGSGRVDGQWWFEGELVKRWERVYASEHPTKRYDKVLEALRPMLAVCYDWNDMLRLVTMTPGGMGIPVLTGQGTHQPIESAQSKHYDPQEKVVFIGGFQQVYVPFVPVQLVSNYA